MTQSLMLPTHFLITLKEQTQGTITWLWRITQLPVKELNLVKRIPPFSAGGASYWSSDHASTLSHSPSNSNSEAYTRSTLNSKAFLRKDLMKEGEWTLSVMQFQDSRPEKLRKEVEQLRTSWTRDLTLLFIPIPFGPMIPDSFPSPTPLGKASNYRSQAA